MKNQKLVSLFLIIFLGSLLFPLASLAGEYKTVEGKTIEYDGLVPCGKPVKIDGQYIDEKIISKDETIPLGYGVVEILPNEKARIAKEVPCQFCHFLVMFKGIFDWFLLVFVPIIAVLMLVIGGIMFMFALFGGAEMLPGGVRGGPAMLSRARRLITSVVIGLVIIFAAWIIVNTIFTFIGLSDFSLQLRLDKWFQINCPIKL